jgi:hypothetical protein
MTCAHSSVFRFFALAAYAFGVGLPHASTAAGAPLEWRFDVFVDDRFIGEHSFRVEPSTDRWVLTTTAKFEVKILFFTAFRYDHSNIEVWDQAGLLRIEASTDSNGTLYRVNGERVEDQFSLNTQDGDRLLPGDVMTFAYWNPAILGAQELLNSQTGDVLQIQVEESGPDEVLYNDEPLQTIRYDIQMEKGPISLWYGRDDQRWTALESVTDGGRRLRYVPRELPEAFNLQPLMD